MLQTQTTQTHLSLRTCRDALEPECSWATIGQALQTILHSACDTEHFYIHTLLNGGNTNVFMCYYHADQIIMKEHLFLRGCWELTRTMLTEIRVASILSDCHWAPTLVFVHVLPDTLRLGIEYIPFALSDMLCDPGAILLRRYLYPLLLIVHELHTMGIAHRDIKPEHLRVRVSGDLVLIDFDACTWLDMPDRRWNVGTPQYRDPYLSETSDLLTYDYTWLDAFSVGAVLLYLLLGGHHALPTQARRLCHEHQLSELETHIVCGLVDATPSTRLTLTAAINMYNKTRESPGPLCSQSPPSAGQAELE